MGQTVKNRQSYEGKISEYPVNMVAQASKYGRSFRNCFKASMRRTYPVFFVKHCINSGLIGTQYDMPPSGAPHKVNSQDN